MKIADFQLRLIEALDPVVADVEKLVTDERAWTPPTIAELKTRMETLLAIVNEIASAEEEEEEAKLSVSRMRESVEDLKRKLGAVVTAETAMEEPAADVVLQEEDILPAAAPAMEAAEETPAADEEILAEEETPAEEEAPAADDEIIAMTPAAEAAEETPAAVEETVQPDWISHGEDLPQKSEETIEEPEPVLEETEEEKPAFEPVIEPEISVAPQPAEEPAPDVEPQAIAEPEPEPLPEPDLSEFMPSAEEEPTSYITEITSMVQAGTGQEEQDKPRTAVSSTAMPDDRIVNQLANRGSIFSKLQETQKMSTGDPQNALRAVLEKMKAKSVNEVHQPTSTNIRNLIGVNERFLLLNNLFKGNTQEYNNLLQAIDEKSTYDEAIAVLTTYAQRFSWNAEDLPFITLQDLIGKRFPER